MDTIDGDDVGTESITPEPETCPRLKSSILSSLTLTYLLLSWRHIIHLFTVLEAYRQIALPQCLVERLTNQPCP